MAVPDQVRAGDTTELIAALRAAAGGHNVLTSARQTERFRRSFRGNDGAAAAVVQPRTLLELWRVIEACVAHDAVVIMQAANTSLTNGATPDGDDYDRPVVIVSTLRLDDIRVLDAGRQVLSFAGGTLFRLEQVLKPLGRQPHSVIGSSCIGASIVGGVCNNSGGSLVQRGPAYTELSLFAQIGLEGKLTLVNHLGIRLGDAPEEILTRLQDGGYTAADIEHDTGSASDHDYAARVREIDEPSAARFNADPRRLHDASGCGGKLAVFAVRLDTFAADTGEAVFYAGSNDPAALTELRRTLLTRLRGLPIAGEYMHRDMFDVARRYGKDTLMLIYYLGTDVMPGFFALKGRLDASFAKVPFLPRRFVDRAVQALTRLWPEMLPRRLLDFRDRFEHHFMLKVSAELRDEAEALLKELFGRAEGDFFLCTPDEGKRAFLHRFAAAGAAERYAIVHDREVEGILPLDIALRRNDPDWVEVLPPEIDAQLERKLYYGHLLCHVFHQDYAVKKGADIAAIKARMLEGLEARGAQYPAEHNVGHLYEAMPEQVAFYQRIDPTNAFNPGIGKTSKLRGYGIANS